MARLNKEILFSPIRNWGNGESKVLLEYNGEGGVRRRRQFLLEDIASWHLVKGFVEKVADMLRNTYFRMQRLKKEGVAGGLWNHMVT